jgi:hypothetical protein
MFEVDLPDKGQFIKAKNLFDLIECDLLHALRVEERVKKGPIMIFLFVAVV